MRIMVFAMRKFDSLLVDQFNEFLHERQDGRGKGEKMWPQSFFEREMTFLGVTAVEDTLQFKAPETIKMLQDSGIQVWVCTGDKYETTLGVA